MNVTILPSVIGGTMPAPPSKSLSHRLLIAAGLAGGNSLVQGLDLSNDITATSNCLRALGTQVQPGRPDPKTGLVEAQVSGNGRLQVPQVPMHCGESGSTLRFFIPIAGLLDAPVRLTAEGRLPQRPQQVYEDIFADQGLRFEKDETGITLCGPLKSGNYTFRGDVSSQFVTGLLFALPLLPGDSTITLTGPVESRSYIALTLSALHDFGVQADWQDEKTLRIPGGQHYCPRTAMVEGDYSQAAFGAVLGAVCGGVTIGSLRPDSLQGDAAILKILTDCGASWQRSGDQVTFEKAALHGCEIDLADCPDLGPILMVLAMFCQGRTVIKNAGRLRIKESDRIAAMQEELAKMGGIVRCEGDTLYMEGTALHAPTQPLQSHNDHRIAMAMVIACLAAGVPAQLQGAEAVRKSWPGFYRDIALLGGKVENDGER